MTLCDGIENGLSAIAAQIALFRKDLMDEAPIRNASDGGAPIPEAIAELPAKPRGSSFAFGSISKDNLAEVDPLLSDFAHELLRRSPVDFRVYEGKRSMERQRELVRLGKSQTLKSRHLTGHAIDLVAWEDGKPDWSWEKVFSIAAHAPFAAREVGLKIRWGAAWHIQDIRACVRKEDAGRTMVELYKQARRAQGRKPFLDGVHYEIPA